ncbi:Uncharacterised protein [Mycobacteroides abscessus subsp. abscessus]|nr:Uncharacterised protein [Mycobacteroides abscessus subsp. abscessus]SKU64643.1 Uncharacterised protein [Mycobacteroides abscessus subsp. abscessus]
MPSRTRSQRCEATPSSSYPTEARPCTSLRSAVTFMTGEPYFMAPSLSGVANEVPA